jgi:hypothetical protein
LTGHVTALYPAFLAATLAAGAPPMMAALALAYFSNLNAAMTHYGTGSAPVFFGAGYVRQATGLGDLAGESSDLAGDRAGVVEAGGDLVKPGFPMGGLTRARAKVE